MKLKAVDYFHKKLHFKCPESAPESASGVSTQNILQQNKCVGSIQDKALSYFRIFYKHQG